jgi:dynein heavy chain
MPEFERLLLFRALRPDRLTAAMKMFVTNIIGAKYVTSQPYDLERSFVDASPGTPIFVFLSPGVDVVSDSALRESGSLLNSQCLRAEFHTLCLFEGQASVYRYH